MRIVRSLPVLAVVPLVLALGLPVTAAASYGNDGDVERRGQCSGSATWKLKAGPDDGRLEVEAEVDQNRVGRVWSWGIRRNGVLVASGRSRTTAPSGSFEVERKIANPRGGDLIQFRAHSATGGYTCGAALRV